MKCFKILAVAAVAAALALSAGSAHAAFVLTLDDTAIGAGPEIIISDDAPIGFVTASGLVTNTLDGFSPGLGSISFSGGVGGGVFGITISGAVSKPVIGGPVAGELDIVNLSVTTTGAGTLVIRATDDFFNPGAVVDPTLNSLVTTYNGTSNGTVSVVGDFDAANAEFGSSTSSGVLGPQGPGPINLASAVNIPGGVVGSYSLSGTITIVHTGGGQTTSGNFKNKVVPEPATCVIWSLLGGIGLAFRRRRRRRVA